MFSRYFQQHCTCFSMIIFLNSHQNVGSYRELEIAIAQYGSLAVCLETNQERNNYARLQNYSVKT